jgi:hypothetical protein
MRSKSQPPTRSKSPPPTLNKLFYRACLALPLAAAGQCIRVL